MQRDQISIAVLGTKKVLGSGHRVIYNSDPEDIHNSIDKNQWQSVIRFHTLSQEEAATKIDRVLDIIKKSLEVKGGETNG